MSHSPAQRLYLNKDELCQEQVINQYHASQENTVASSILVALNLVPSKATKILDIGCSIGTLGNLLKKQWKGTQSREITGIEFIAQAAKEARKTLDNVIEADLDKLETIPYPYEYFDCITALDVLEHITEPDRLLTVLLPYLKKDGRLVCSIPNFFHYSTFLHLLQACRFTNECTNAWHHLRFWGILEIIESVNSLNLEIENPIMGTTSTPHPFIEEIFKKAEKHFGTLYPNLFFHTQIVQYLFSIKKTATIPVNQTNSTFTFNLVPNLIHSITNINC